MDGESKGGNNTKPLTDNTEESSSVVETKIPQPSRRRNRATLPSPSTSKATSLRNKNVGDLKKFDSWLDEVLTPVVPSPQRNVDHTEATTSNEDGGGAKRRRLEQVEQPLPPSSDETDKIPVNKRLVQELKILLEDPPPGVEVDQDYTTEDTILLPWQLKLTPSSDSLYEGEELRLQLTFGANYPFVPPKLTFVGASIPVHPMVYGDGNLLWLTNRYTPAFTVGGIALSVLAMFNEKRRPEEKSEAVSFNDSSTQ